ncbi:MAG: hypothetical protein GAK30_01343 [Paracidovorax wautersii]|uniref:Metallo-beta-lactamase domain-containing protein n=1 Tax=Paracidovorax wautersii TaxID=1177982 RepID=A0A7V8FQ53_9BURK|nr:MAG: hypothetical protein GAK30_01343 [Paracidovorax wautersii]
MTSPAFPSLHRRQWLALATTSAAGLLSAGAAVAQTSTAAAPLTLQVYNPQDKAIFPVSSVLVTGRRDAVLIDAQFQRNDAQALVQLIRASGKRLTTIYISHSDPDYYFGLDVLQDAFPAARIVATANTVAAIHASMQGKQAYWSPILKANAPRRLVLPQVLQGSVIALEGQSIEIVGLQGPDPLRTFAWIPSLRTVAGGVVVSSGIHVWIADTQTPASRQAWLQTLDRIEALQPARVVPGHFIGPAPAGTAAVAYTRGYIQAFEAEAARTKGSAALAQAMKRRYPQAAEDSSLELSAKAIQGEMKWPQ